MSTPGPMRAARRPPTPVPASLLPGAHSSPPGRTAPDCFPGAGASSARPASRFKLKAAGGKAIISENAMVVEGVTEDAQTLWRDGIIGKKGPFPREWVEQLREDI